MILTKTTPAEVPAVLAIYREAQAFMAAQGLDQWQDGYPNEASLREDMEKGISYVLREGSEVLATMAVLLTPEPTYARIEGAWGTPMDSPAVHRVAVKAAGRRTGAASRLLEEAGKLAAEAGFTALRIDTHTQNRPMRGMLEKNGFIYRGIIFLENGAPRVAYDKKLSEQG